MHIHVSSMIVAHDIKQFSFCKSDQRAVQRWKMWRRRKKTREDTRMTLPANVLAGPRTARTREKTTEDMANHGTLSCQRCGLVKVPHFLLQLCESSLPLLLLIQAKGRAVSRKMVTSKVVQGSRRARLLVFVNEHTLEEYRNSSV